MVLSRRADGSYEGVAWNLCREGREAVELHVAVPAEGKLALMTRTVDEVTTNPLKAWHEMGEPSSLSREQLRFLRQAGQPLCASEQIEAKDGAATVMLTLRENAVAHFVLAPVKGEPDVGYDYEWYRQHA